MNSVLLLINVMIACIAFVAWRSPKCKFAIGYRLQVSAKADWKRAEYKQQLIAQFDETAVCE